MEILGQTTCERGAYQKAQKLLDEALKLARELNNHWYLHIIFLALGELALNLACLEDAMTFYGESFTHCKGLGNDGAIANSIEGVAMVHAARGQAEQAAHLFGAADSLRAKTNASLPAPQAREREHYMQKARSALGDQAWEQAWSKGSVRQ